MILYYILNKIIRLFAGMSHFGTARDRSPVSLDACRPALGDCQELMGHEMHSVTEARRYARLFVAHHNEEIRQA